MTNSTTVPDVSFVFHSDIISDQQLQMIMIVNVCTIIGLIGVVGTICNIINIIIFVKQGIKDTTNISLLGIAVADTGALVTLLWGGICLNPLIIQRFEDFEMSEIQYLTSSWPHVYFVRVTGWLTVFVNIERYLCIAYPLKVRSLVTPQRTVVINVIIFVIVMADIIPIFTSTSLLSKFSFSKNRTVIGIMHTSGSETMLDVFSLYGTSTKLVSFVTVAVMTSMLVHKLKYTTKWRQSTSSTSKTGNVSVRDQRIVVMVIFISVIFILCYLPVVVFFVVTKIEKQLTVTGRYKNLFLSIGSLWGFLEAVNCTANIFVYLRMSSKYREMFVSLFTRTSRKK